jgi:predicted nucleotidyltransferase
MTEASFALIAAYFPEVNMRVAHGTLDRADALRAWAAVEASIQEEVKAVIVHGSIIHQSVRPFSDIDLLVIVSGSGSSSRKLEVADGYLTDITVLPIQSVTVAAQKAARSKLYGEVTGLVEGLLLLGDEEVFKRAKAHVQGILSTQDATLHRMKQGIEARIFGRLVDLAVNDLVDRQKPLMADIHGLCASVASLREVGQILPLPVVYERLPPADRDVLSQLCSWPPDDATGFIRMVVEQFKIETFDNWLDMVPR